MFGFTRARYSELSCQEYTQLRQYYCGLCHGLRNQYGLTSGLFTGYEGLFLALLVDSQMQIQSPTGITSCPASLGLLKNPVTGLGVPSQYAAAITCILASHKLDDSITDEKSIIARFAKSILHSKFHRARVCLETLGFPYQDLEPLLRWQNIVEQNPKKQTLHNVTAPSAAAVALFFAHTSTLAKAPYNYEILCQIGSRIGRLITLLDACDDFARDMKQKQFNAINATLPSRCINLAIPEQNLTQIENYLLVQLRKIRSLVLNLQLRKNENLINNVLMMGLFDVTTNSFRKLSNNILSNIESCTDNKECLTCGKSIVIEAKFCPDCGENQHINTLSLNA